MEFVFGIILGYIIKSITGSKNNRTTKTYKPQYNTLTGTLTFYPPVQRPQFNIPSRKNY